MPNGPRRALRVLPLAALAVGLVAPGASRADDLQLPNLTPKPPYQIQIGEPDPDTETEFPLVLRLAVTDRNLGRYPLEIVGAPPREDPRYTGALQCVQWASRACLERRDVGDMAFHPNHGHWHIENYALYEIRRLLPDQTPDLSAAGFVASGPKASFCLIDIEHQETRPDDPFNQTGFYKGCTGAFQGISPGWADIYSAGLDGQQVPLDSVPDPDGVYALVITINPDGRILEDTRADNVSFKRIRIFNHRTQVEVLP